VTSERVLRLRIGADDLRADAPAVCADVVARLGATGARRVLADVVVDPACVAEPGCARPGGTADNGTVGTARASVAGRPRGPRVDLGTLDGLARLELAVHRAGARLELVGAATDLRALLLLTGLADVLAGGSALEHERQPEDAEVVGADEVGDAADAAVADLEQVDRPRHARPVGPGLVLGEPAGPVGLDRQQH
jgi:hypothetical protein